MKKYFNFLLLAALLCGMSLSVTSCKSDDDNGGGTDSEVLDGELSDEAMHAWSWVNALTDAAEQPADWQTKSFDATIGVPSSNEETARLIFVSDLDDAKTSFASIAGCDPEELNGTKTVSAGEYGSMTWNISAPGAPNIATVDVDSKLLKKLSKLVYCTEEQSPDNAAEIEGNCYYRLGDVVEDLEGFYWVCVQPSFLGKKNHQSYWVNVFNASENGRGVNSKKLPGMPAKNIQSKWTKKAKYNNNIINLPTGLKMDRKQIYNFSNLIWALLNPSIYLEAIGKDKNGLAGLPVKYHGLYYLDKVGEMWANKDFSIYEKLFNRTAAQMKQMKKLHFFYYGYHWKSGTKAGVWIYNSEGYQKNYSGKLADDDVLFEMKAKNYGIDIKRYVSDSQADKNCASTGQKDMAPAQQFTETEGYWVIRVATGEQLDKNYKPFEDSQNLWDVFNFNIHSKFSGYLVGNEYSVATDEQLERDFRFDKEL